MARAGEDAHNFWAHPTLCGDVRRWLERGVFEFVREDDGALHQRITRRHEPEFLDRIAESLRGQFGYITTIETKP